MPLYLVRWADLSAALVTAYDEEHLLDVLDEVANPEGCRWTEYDGPVFVELSLPVDVELEQPDGSGRPVSPEQLRVGDLAALKNREGLRAVVPDADTAAEMSQEIMRFAFPHVHRVYWEGDDDIEEGPLREAVEKEALAIVSSAWRRAHAARSRDPDDRLAAVMDAPPRLVKHWRKQAEAKSSTPTGKKPGGRGKKKQR